MKKETGVAIFFGVILGLVVAVVMVLRLRGFVGQRILPGENQVTPTVAASNSIQPLEISSPTPNIITSNNIISIKGKVVVGSLIVIQSPIRDMTFVNKNQDFSTDFPLSLGENVISITAYPKNSQTNPQSKTLRVYYLDQL